MVSPIRDDLAECVLAWLAIEIHINQSKLPAQGRCNAHQASMRPSRSNQNGLASKTCSIWRCSLIQYPHSPPRQQAEGLHNRPSHGHLGRTRLAIIAQNHGSFIDRRANQVVLDE